MSVCVDCDSREAVSGGLCLRCWEIQEREDEARANLTPKDDYGPEVKR